MRRKKSKGVEGKRADALGQGDLVWNFCVVLAVQGPFLFGILSIVSLCFSELHFSFLLFGGALRALWLQSRASI